ncbi:CmcJ/NvfI family oxidoreductase [Bradyrhizobium sp. B124]|uniref:CmcJ/NvfI family oxidoreductase n=1 Tax=Bradyrhizobium sp. B124 TaxID=3140245 RepID=UPI00318324F9
MRARTPVDRDKLDSVQGRMGFARRSPDEKALAVVAPSPGYDFPKVVYDVTIRNMRPVVDELSFEKEGFIILRHELSCLNERDPDLLSKKYLEEMVPLLKDYFKASWVQTADLGGINLRSLGGEGFFTRPTDDTKSGIRKTGTSHAHIDYSPVGGPMIAARDCQLQGIEIRAYSRLMIIQAWQALSPPPQDHPLTFCDAGSIEAGDLVEVDYRGHGVTHKSWALRHNPSHRWYYLPDMTHDEIYLFKGYDSADHHHRWSAHSTFENRGAYPDAKPRASIESRFFVYYE